MATLKDYLISGKFTGDISVNGFHMSLKDMLISAKLSGNGGGGLPAGYTQYDYLTQTLDFMAQARDYIIHTPAQLKTDYTIEAKFFLPSGLGSNTSMTPIFGTRNGNSGSKEFAFFYRNNNDGKFGYWYDGTDTTTAISISKDICYTAKVKPVGTSETYPNNVTIDLNGTEYNTGSASTGKTFDPWFGIFGYAISATGVTTNSVVYEGMQVGDILITDSNGVPVYHFVPAKDADGKYGYYELVNAAFHYNAAHATDGYIGGFWE